MRRLWIASLLCLSALAWRNLNRAPQRVSAQNSPTWAQWGSNPQHTGTVDVAGQDVHRKLADRIYDAFVPQEKGESFGTLTVHYQAPLLDGESVYMEFKTGHYISCNPPGSGMPKPCGPDAWESQAWNERRLDWVNGQLYYRWNFQSDWKPEPNALILAGWEPVFHAVLSGDFVYVPGWGGTVWELKKADGTVVNRINPLGSKLVPDAFVSGPLSTDHLGNIYYNVLELNQKGNPWVQNDAVGSWLVKVTPEGASSLVSFPTLVPGAPAECLGTFGTRQLPWPPSPHAHPLPGPCGSQRSALNVAPAITPDGSTIYTVSRAHFNSTYAYLIAVNSDLTLKWAASLRGHLHDGCNVLLPPNGAVGGCRVGSTTGVDPSQNTPGAGVVIDQSSASPTIAPDGSILFGAEANYNFARGHLFKFGPEGHFLAAYDFGWDTTPAVWSHDGTYSVVLKDNHYPGGDYCGNVKYCGSAPPGPYYITQLSANLIPEWQFKNNTINSMHPDGYEWCINMPAVDANGIVYANSEDGSAYTIYQGGAEKSQLFLKQAVGAAYTPLSIAQDGKVYTENDGHMFVTGR